MIIVPLLMLPFLAAIAKWDLFQAAEDPVFILSAVLLVSSVSWVHLAPSRNIMFSGNVGKMQERDLTLSSVDVNVVVR